MKSVVAIAGRRIDAADATAVRFPLQNADVVRERITRLLEELEASIVVSSGACGGDLLAFEAARGLGMRSVSVLPFPPERFKRESVVDRPGGAERWGPAFDRLMRELRPDDLIVLDAGDSDADQFLAVNERIVIEASRRAAEIGGRAVAVAVWGAVERPGTDYTAQFKRAAERHGLPTIDVPTL